MAAQTPIYVHMMAKFNCHICKKTHAFYVEKGVGERFNTFLDDEQRSREKHKPYPDMIECPDCHNYSLRNCTNVYFSDYLIVPDGVNVIENRTFVDHGVPEWRNERGCKTNGKRNHN